MTQTAPSSVISLTAKQIAQLLPAFILAAQPVLIEGPPGIGKSDCVAQACKIVGAYHMITHPSVEDPTQVSGLPWVANGLPAGEHPKEATFLPFGPLARAMKHDPNGPPLVWNIEDLGQAQPAMQAAYMQLVLLREVNGHKIPDNVMFIATTNGRGHKSGVSGILEAVKSRFTIIHMAVCLDSLLEWGEKTGNLCEEIRMFLGFCPDLVHKFEPTVDINNSPCPRGWARTNKVIKMALPPALKLAAFAGDVGEVAALKLQGFLKDISSMPSLDGIIADPERGPIPDRNNSSTLYAIAAGLGHRVTLQNFDAIGRYAERLYEAGHAEFCGLLILECRRREEQICATPRFIGWSGNGHPIGDLLARKGAR